MLHQHQVDLAMLQSVKHNGVQHHGHCNRMWLLQQHARAAATE